MDDNCFTANDAAHLIFAVLTFGLIGFISRNNPDLRGTLNMIWGSLWTVVVAKTLCAKDPKCGESSKAALFMLGGILCLFFLVRCAACFKSFGNLCQAFSNQHSVASLIPGFITGIILILFGYKLPIVSQEDL